jgi:alkylhydroperoxidase/carboxymuconolactone decarboxylase family protein YurZ
MTPQDERPRPEYVSLARVRQEAQRLLVDVADGDGLDHHTGALVRLAVNASVTALDGTGIDSAIRDALDLGLTTAQVHETLVVVSGLGVHTLMEGSHRLVQALRERGQNMDEPLDATRTALRERLQGTDGYWVDFECEVPGFLDTLLRLSPETYEAFFAYCALPWRTGALRARTKELIAMAADATPTHRYLPGMRLHLANAVRLGAGRAAILHVLDIAAAAPTHPGVAPRDPGKQPK